MWSCHSCDDSRMGWHCTLSHLIQRRRTLIHCHRLSTALHTPGRGGVDLCGMMPVQRGCIHSRLWTRCMAGKGRGETVDKVSGIAVATGASVNCYSFPASQERLSHHYHPVVVKFSMHLCSGIPITYSGNPLLDFSLIRFLDNYVYVVCLQDRIAGVLLCVPLRVPTFSCTDRNFSG